MNCTVVGSRKTIAVEKSIATWRKDPGFVEAYDTLEEEFAFASEVIAVRARAGLSQAELAERMKTSQIAIARLESVATPVGPHPRKARRRHGREVTHQPDCRPSMRCV